MQSPGDGAVEVSTNTLAAYGSLRRTSRESTPLTQTAVPVGTQPLPGQQPTVSMHHQAQPLPGIPRQSPLHSSTSGLLSHPATHPTTGSCYQDQQGQMHPHMTVPMSTMGGQLRPTAASMANQFMNFQRPSTQTTYTEQPIRQPSYSSTSHSPYTSQTQGSPSSQQAYGSALHHSSSFQGSSQSLPMQQQQLFPPQYSAASPLMQQDSIAGAHSQQQQLMDQRFLTSQPTMQAGMYGSQSQLLPP